MAVERALQKQAHQDTGLEHQELLILNEYFHNTP